ncbi:MAG: S8 family serine peptidase [Propionicimonas sp.]
MPSRTPGLITVALTTLALVSLPAVTSKAAPTPGPDIPIIQASRLPDAGRTDTLIVSFDRRRPQLTRTVAAAVETAAEKVADAGIATITPVGTGVVAVTLDAHLSGSERASIVTAVENEDGVRKVEASLTYHVTATVDPTGEAYWRYQWDMGTQWGIKAPQAWSRTTGAGATVGIVDTGITAHPDLSGSNDAIVGGNVVAGYDFISSPATAHDGDGRDADPTDQVASSSFHGTHVAGTIGARLDGEGIVGTAPTVKLQPLRALGDGGGSDFDIMAAMRWGAGLPVPGTPPNRTPVDVLNLSIGGNGPCSVAMQETIAAVTARGVVVVVAAGNEGAPLATASPANCRGVIRVTATGATGLLADYSNFGTADVPATIAAPGGSGIPNPANDLTGSVVSTWNSGTSGPGTPGYAGMTGTSMAAPHVSGVAALLKSLRRALTPAEIAGVLQQTASPLNVSCDRNTCGAGIVDARAAVATEAPAPVTPTLSVTKGPAIRGTPTVARLLTGTAGTWSKKVTLKRQWLRDGQPIRRATHVRYRATPADVDHALTFRVTATRAGYTSAILTSAPVRIRAGSLLLRTGPVITGRRAVGRVLTGKTGSWRPKAKLARQWLRDGQPVAGATHSRLRLTATDRGHRLELRVTATRAGYTTVVRTSHAVLIR